MDTSQQWCWYCSLRRGVFEDARTGAAAQPESRARGSGRLQSTLPYPDGKRIQQYLSRSAPSAGKPADVILEIAAAAKRYPNVKE